jgi:hypothetical protein
MHTSRWISLAVVSIIALAVVCGPFSWLPAAQSASPGGTPAPAAVAKPPAEKASDSTKPAATSAPKTQPTAVPKAQATSAPKAQPTSAPKTQPTAAPRAQATTAPQTQPTAAPKAQATSAPKTQPTQAVATAVRAVATNTNTATKSSTSTTTTTSATSTTAGASSATTAVATAGSPSPTARTSASPTASASPAATAVPSASPSPSSSATAAPKASPTTSSSPTVAAAAKSSASPSPSPVRTTVGEPVATPDSATDAASGDAEGDAGDAETSVQNAQLSAGTAGAGLGSLVVANQQTSSVADSSAASSRTGSSVALVPTAKPANGVTVASSGAASAKGITASNDVNNTSLQAVTVKGANEAPVEVSSDAGLSVQNTGAAGATTGSAWAVAAGANGAPSGVATPNAVNASATSGAVSATGLKASTTVDNSSAANLEIAGNPASTATVVVAPKLVANVTSGGAAAAASGATCAGTACPAPAAGATGGAVTASSGAVSAQGLQAENIVNTNAAVNVNVSGQNFAPIKVIVDTVTHIFNWGAASATSGDATANGTTGGAGGTGAPASSGSAQATGAQVQNTVNLRSSATVTVQGDNYNPINILLNLATNLANWGVGLSASGDAQSTAAGVGPDAAGSSASSGAASASGLQVMNLVNMWAFASVDVEGNNYAPITVEIHFNTNIDNRGYAEAQSGNVAAGSSETRSTAAAQVPVSTSAGGTSSAGGAHGGDSVAVGSVVNAGITSTQMSSANGGKPVTSAALTTMLRNLPQGNWSPLADASLPHTTTPAVTSGPDSRSGDSTARGLQSSISQTNTQLAACSDPSGCLAANLGTISTTTRDLPNNPATGTDTAGTNSDAGFSGVNATPTPVPSPASVSSGQTSGQDNGGGRRTTNRQLVTSSVAFAPDGQVVVVDLWDQWPGRRLPPMPNPQLASVTGNTVQANVNAGWPGVDELPLPIPSDDQSSAGESVAALPATATLHRTGGASADAPADPEDAEYPPLYLVDVDPWAGLPQAQMMPMPVQVVPALQVETAAAVAAAPAVPTDDLDAGDAGASPLEDGAAGLLAVSFAGLALARRGRWQALFAHIRRVRIGRQH